MAITKIQVLPQNGDRNLEHQKEDKTKPEQHTPPTLNSQLSPCRRYLSLSLCFLECLIFGGTFFGWSSLVYVYKADGIYSHLCSNNLVDALNSTMNNSTDNSSSTSFPICDAQAEQLSLAFTIGLAVQGLASFPVGLIFDKFGLLPTRLLCSMFAIPAYLLLAFAKRETSWMVFPGSAALAVACIILILTNSHVAQLAGSNTAMITFLYNGAINSSSAVLLLIKFCHESGIPYIYSLSILCGLWIIVFINTLFILPKYKAIPSIEPVPKENNEMLSFRKTSRSSSPKVIVTRITDVTESPKNTMQTSHGKENDNIGVCEVENIEDSYEGQQVKGYETKANQKNVKEHNSNGSSCDNKGFVHDENKKNGLEIVDKSTVSKDSDIVNMKEFSSAQCVFSAMNIIYLFWFACLHVTIMFFLAAFNMRATNIANGDLDKVSHYTNVLAYAQMCALLVAPPTGLLVDWRRKTVIKNGLHGQRRAIAAFLPILITEVAGLILVAACLGHSETLLYVSICASEVFRSTLYPTAIAYLGITWPGSYFGVLFGLAYLVNGGSAMMQYPYTIWIQTNGFFPVDLFMLGTCCASLVLPVYIGIRHIKGNSQGREDKTSAWT